MIRALTPTTAFLLATACTDSPADGPHDRSSAVELDDTRVSAVATGTVMSVAPSGRFVTLDHAPIPEIGMGAMRMGFDVAEGVDVSALDRGDDIRFSMEASDAIGIRITAFCVPARDGEECAPGQGR